MYIKHNQIVPMASLKSTFLITLILLLQFSEITSHSGHDHADEPPTAGDSAGKSLHNKGLILVKVWCLIIMFITTFAGGVSPYFYRWNESFLLLGTQFAGGVFLGTALMHFLSDATETFGDLTEKEYPFSYMLACAGYVLTMLGDTVIAYVVKEGDRVDVEDGNKAEEEAEHHPVFARTSSVGDTVLLILALCFHSVFEGIAVGVAGNFRYYFAWCVKFVRSVKLMQVIQLSKNK